MSGDVVFLLEVDNTLLDNDRVSADLTAYLDDRFGRDVVAAATIPPVGAYLSAFNVISDRTTTSFHSPLYWQRLTHSRHHCSVSSTVAPFAGDFRERRKPSMEIGRAHV